MAGRRSLLDLFARWDDRSEPIELTELTNALGGLSLSRTDLSDALVFDDCSYRRVAIHTRPHYEAFVLCWKSGQSSPIHDHLGSSCAVLVVEGVATETVYGATPCGRLVPVHSHSIQPGETAGAKDEGVHQMANLQSAGQDLITLHVYSPPPSSWRYFPLAETTLANHDDMIQRKPSTITAELGHTIPKPPMGQRHRRRQTWKV